MFSDFETNKKVFLILRERVKTVTNNYIKFIVMIIRKDITDYKRVRIGHIKK